MKPLHATVLSRKMCYVFRGFAAVDKAFHCLPIYQCPLDRSSRQRLMCPAHIRRVTGAFVNHTFCSIYDVSPIVYCLYICVADVP